MMEYRKGYFVKSKAGHDKGKTYIIIEGPRETGMPDLVMVTDGEYKPVEKPKKKKTKHLQVVLQCDRLIEDKIATGQHISNEDIKTAIQSYINR